MTVGPFTPVRLGPLTLRNRFVKAATFEGTAKGGTVTDALVRFHRTVAEGGAAMTTLAYCAVSPDGRGAPNEIVMNDRALPGLARLAETVHDAGAALSVQIGHAGPVASAAGRRGLAPSRVFAPQAMRFTRAATTQDIERVVASFAEAARTAARAGADAIELHFGHGYLVSAFLSPKLNRRRDGWGGTTAGRARLARRVAEAAREAAGPSVAVLAKLNMTDGVRGGLDTGESLEAAALLERDGTLDALVLSAGSSFQNPMYLLRGPAPVAELAASFPQPMRLAVRITGRRFLRDYPFEEAYLLPLARRFRAELTMPLVLLGGITRLETAETAIAEGFDLVAMARALLREPDLVHRWRAGDHADATCIHCNRCVPSIYTGTRCVIDHPVPHT